MTVVYATENFKDLMPELKELLPLHWKEIALNHNEVPLDPDWDNYLRLNECGKLHCVTARFGTKLIGYHVAIISGHLHYKSTLHCITDVYYILPEYRRGFVGVKLFQKVEADMRAAGVKKLFTGTKKHLDLSRMFEWLGYKPVETLFAKILR